MAAQPPNPLPYATPGYPQPQPKRGRSLFGWVLFIGLAVMLFLLLQTKHRSAGVQVPVSELFAQLNAGNVSEILVEGDTLRARLKGAVNYSTASGPTPFILADLPAGTAQSWKFIRELIYHQSAPAVRVENNNSVLLNVFIPLIPWLLIFLFIWFFVFRQLRKRPANPVATPVYMVHPPEQK